MKDNIMRKDWRPNISEPHNLSPSGECLDCGASSEEVKDNLVTSCYKFTGPHALALKTLDRTIRERTYIFEAYRKTLDQNEDALVSLSKHIRVYETDLQELVASFNKLLKSET